MARRLRRLLAGLIGAMAVMALLAGAGWLRAIAPGPLDRDTTVIIAKGATTPEIADQLTEAGVLFEPYTFRIAGRVSGDDAPLRSGEYALPARIAPVAVLEVLRAGRTVVRKLTIPEGLTTAQVLARVEAAEGLAGDIGPTPEEGALLPATYSYSWGDNRAELVATMAQEMRTTVDRLWAKRGPGLPLASAREAVILASIVEKETAVAAERPRIAAVFLNRLNAGMRLQADPTVAYAAAGAAGASLGRALTANDLRAAHPYNTYVISGLPPGPIANPGRASLTAVLQPATTDEFFFVADGSGGHVFARTYEEHKANVARWRAMRAEIARTEAGSPASASDTTAGE
jgi:UPF0755 protein